MQILYKDLPRMKLLPETLADLWYLEKLINPGDLVASVSYRKFVADSGATERKKIWVKINVESVKFQRFSNNLRILGTIVEGKPEELVSFGSHHTIDVSPGTSVDVEKKKWMKYHMSVLDRAIKASQRPKLILVAMDERDAGVFSLTESGLDHITDISISGGGKWGNVDDSIRLKYFHDLAKVLKTYNVPHIIVGGPGFAKSDFLEFCKSNYSDLVSKLVTVDLGSSGRSGINEMLSRPEINKALEDARIARETRLVNQLMAEIGKNGLATYGFEQVKEALDYGAVEKLLMSETFFSDHREECEDLFNVAEQTRAEIDVIGDDYDPGKQLNALGGIAATLRFSV